MRALVIHNPVSGPKSGDVFDFVRSALRPGDEFDVRASRSGDDIAALAATAAGYDVVVASGGDGTVARAAYAMRGTGVPLVVFPSGTANLLANNLGSATESAAIANSLREGRLVTLDMGEIEYEGADGPRKNGFLTMAGAGFDASIMKGSQDLKPVFGQLSYYLSAFGNPHPTVAHLTMELDGDHVEADGICVLVGVWGNVSPNFPLIPDSSPRDGLLDVAIVKTDNAIPLIPTVVGSLLGQGINDPAIEIRHVHEVTLACDPPLPMQFDGEVITDGTTPFTMRAIPGGVTTVVDKLSPLFDEGTPTGLR